MAFSAQGNRLAVGAEDRTARVYDMRDGREISRISFAISPWSVGFSADGSSMLSLTGAPHANGGTQAAIVERSLDMSMMIADVCRRLEDRALSETDWNRYLPGVAYRHTCATPRR
jgi:WD40 repeat protein